MNSIKSRTLIKALFILLSASACAYFLGEKIEPYNQEVLIQKDKEATQVSLSQADQLEKDVNAFVLAFLISCDESVFSKQDKIASYFVSRNRQNYQDAIKDIMDPDIESYLTTGGPVQNLTKKGDTLHFTTDFKREVDYGDKSISTVFGKREWIIKSDGSNFKIDSYKTTLLDQEPSTVYSTSMDLEAIAKGDYSSVAGTWLSNQSSLTISPNGVVSQPNFLALPEPFTKDEHITSSGVIRANLANKSGVGKSLSVYFVPSGESIDPNIPGYHPQQNKDRILILEYSTGSNPLPTIFQEYTRP